MGVPELFKLWIIDVLKLSLVPIERPVGLLMDLNGLIHAVASDYFVLNDEDMRKNNRYEDRQAKINAYNLYPTETINVFITTLISAIEEVIDVINPELYVVLAIDGIAPLAKINQQRARRFNTVFERDFQGGFDNIEITAGTPLMDEITKRIKHHLEIEVSNPGNKVRRYTYFSGSDEPGEGEHKMFRIFNERVYREIFEGMNQAKIDDIVYNRQHIVYGLDADLCFLSLPYVNNFLWVRKMYPARIDREGRTIDNITDGVPVNKVREYLINRMKPGVEDANKFMVFRDFQALSFLIGDDFVPIPLMLDVNNGRTLEKLIDAYREVNAYLIHYEQPVNYNHFGQCQQPRYGQYHWGVLLAILEKMLDYEKLCFNEKKQLQTWYEQAEAYRSHYDQTGQSDERYRSAMEQNYQHINQFAKKHGKSGRYYPTSLFSSDYETTAEEWTKFILAPNISSKNIGYLRSIFNQHSQEDLIFIVKDYLTGLQWNLAYYMGYNIGNWYYKFHIAPTIYNMVSVLKSGYSDLPTLDSVMMKGNEQPLTRAQQLTLLLHHPKADHIIRKCNLTGVYSATKTGNNPPKLLIPELKYLFPLTIIYIDGGKFEKTIHTKVTVLPLPKLTDIARIPNKSSSTGVTLTFKGDYTYTYNINRNVPTFNVPVSSSSTNKNAASVVVNFNLTQSNIENAKKYEDLLIVKKDDADF